MLQTNILLKTRSRGLIQTVWIIRSSPFGTFPKFCGCGWRLHHHFRAWNATCGPIVGIRKVSPRPLPRKDSKSINQLELWVVFHSTN